MRHKHAFTLIELLVVIAIIAILMAIIMPALKKAKNQAQSAACQGNLKGYTYAMQIFIQDHDDNFPDARSVYFSQIERYPAEDSGGRSAIHYRFCNDDVNLRKHPEYGSDFFKNLADARSLICPTFKRIAKNAKGLLEFGMDSIDAIPHYNPWYNYTMNAYLGKTGGVIQKASQIKDPGYVFVFADEGCIRDPGYNLSGLNDTEMWPIYAEAEAQAAIKKYGSKRAIKAGPGAFGTFCDIIGGFHNAPSNNILAGKGNCTFVDGHVEPVLRDDTFSHAWPK